MRCLGNRVEGFGVPRDMSRRFPVTATFGTLVALVALAGCGLLLSLGTANDGFIYLVLQKKGGGNSGFLPLFYVATAASYALFSVPAGLCADKFGRRSIFLGGYAILVIIYSLLFFLPAIGLPAKAGCLLLLGLYYAGTEGVLTAMASAAVPPEMRASGLAFLATAIALGKAGSSLLFRRKAERT